MPQSNKNTLHHFEKLLIQLDNIFKLTWKGFDHSFKGDLTKLDERIISLRNNTNELHKNLIGSSSYNMLIYKIDGIKTTLSNLQFLPDSPEPGYPFKAKTFHQEKEILGKLVSAEQIGNKTDETIEHDKKSYTDIMRICLTSVIDKYYFTVPYGNIFEDSTKDRKMDVESYYEFMISRQYPTVATFRPIKDPDKHYRLIGDYDSYMKGVCEVVNSNFSITRLNGTTINVQCDGVAEKKGNKWVVLRRCSVNVY